MAPDVGEALTDFFDDSLKNLGMHTETWLPGLKPIVEFCSLELINGFSLQLLLE